jgi:hypothetical protein
MGELTVRDRCERFSEYVCCPSEANLSLDGCSKRVTVPADGGSLRCTTVDLKEGIEPIKIV